MPIKKFVSTFISACALGIAMFSCFTATNTYNLNDNETSLVESASDNYEISLMFYIGDVCEGL